MIKIQSKNTKKNKRQYYRHKKITTQNKFQKNF